MDRKKIRYLLILISSVFIFLLVLLNVCSFAIPFPKFSLPLFYSAYGFAEFVLVVQFVISVLEIVLEKDRNQRVIGLPIHHFGFVSVIVQMVITGIFYLVNAFIECPFWIFILAELVVVGMSVIRTCFVLFFKKKNEEYHENLADTDFMDSFSNRLKSLSSRKTDEKLYSLLLDLAETASGSDPVSNSMTLSIEKEMGDELKLLEGYVSDGDILKAMNSASKLKDELSERNGLCKEGK